MKANSFEQEARLVRLEGFKANLKKLRIKYREVNDQFNNLCDELDNQVLNEQHLVEITNNLTIYLAEMDLIEKKIKEISEIMETLRIELSN